MVKTHLDEKLPWSTMIIEKIGSCRAASESQWDQALVGLAGKVLNTPSELHAWLAAALDAMSQQCIAGETYVIWHAEAEWLPPYTSQHYLSHLEANTKFAVHVMQHASYSAI